MISIKKFCKFLIFGKISPGHKKPDIFEEIVTEENSISYNFTTKSKIRDEKLVCNNDGEAICQDEHDMGYMATMFPFSPPGENNMPPVEEISDYAEQRKHWLAQVKRKRGLMIPEDEPLFKKHIIKRHAEYEFDFFLTINPETE